jgi:hypothetical protein
LRRIVLTFGIYVAALSFGSGASAQAPAPMVVPPTSSEISSPTAHVPSGLAVVAEPGATGAAWGLAQSVYAAEAIRPLLVDEPHARVLCGEVASPAEAPDLRDLAQMVAAVRGDTAPSRAILGDLARRFRVRALIVVRAGSPSEGGPTARVFLPDAGLFDAAVYSPDDSPTPGWSGAVRSLVRAYGMQGPSSDRGTLRVPAIATAEIPKGESIAPKKPSFYQSGWFWGAIAAAALTSGVTYFAVRDNGPATIHLELQVPH